MVTFQLNRHKEYNVAVFIRQIGIQSKDQKSPAVRLRIRGEVKVSVLSLLHKVHPLFSTARVDRYNLVVLDQLQTVSILRIRSRQ